MFADLKWFNPALAAQPMNWAIVFAIASLWLLLFHTAMIAWQAMTSGGTRQSFNAPGQIASPVADVTSVFSQAGILGSSSNVGGLDTFIGGVTSVWTNGSEAKYAEDGWDGNP